MTIGKRISEIRKTKNLSQEYIAERLGVSRQAVSKWEMDASVPDTNNLIGLAEILGVSVEFLATGRRVEFEPTDRKSQTDSKKIAGYILLGAGLLGLLLSICLSSFIAAFLVWVLAIVSVYLVAGSIVCLAVKRNAGLWLLLVYAAMTALFVLILMIFMIRPFPPSYDITNGPSGVSAATAISLGGILLSIVLPASVVAVIAIAVAIKRKNK